jgi:hypothetical protein
VTYEGYPRKCYTLTMSEYKEGFQDGYTYAKEELVEKLSEVEGLDSWTLEVICDMIERNKL